MNKIQKMVIIRPITEKIEPMEFLVVLIIALNLQINIIIINIINISERDNTTIKQAKATFDVCSFFTQSKPTTEDAREQTDKMKIDISTHFDEYELQQLQKQHRKHILYF
jgi:hypothetical protein